MNKSCRQSLVRVLLAATTLLCTLTASADYSAVGSQADAPFVSGAAHDLWFVLADIKHDRDNYHKRYQKLSPEQREQLRQRREDFKSLPPEERERIHKAREKFRNLPPGKRQELKEKWKKMPPEERQKLRKHKGKPHRK